MTYEKLFELAQRARDGEFTKEMEWDVLDLSPTQLADWLHMLGTDRYHIHMPWEVRNRVYETAGSHIRAVETILLGKLSKHTVDNKPIDWIAMIRQRIADKVTKALGI